MPLPKEYDPYTRLGTNLIPSAHEESSRAPNEAEEVRDLGRRLKTGH